MHRGPAANKRHRHYAETSPTGAVVLEIEIVVRALADHSHLHMHRGQRTRGFCVSTINNAASSAGINGAKRASSTQDSHRRHAAQRAESSRTHAQNRRTSVNSPTRCPHVNTGNGSEKRK